METTMRGWALAQIETGKAPVYISMFSRVHPYVDGVTFSDHDPKTVGAYHTGEVPYWLETQDAYNMFRPTRSWTAYDRDSRPLPCRSSRSQERKSEYPGDYLAALRSGERTDDGVRRLDRRPSHEHKGAGLLRSLTVTAPSTGGGVHRASPPSEAVTRRGVGCAVTGCRSGACSPLVLLQIGTGAREWPQSGRSSERVPWADVRFAYKRRHFSRVDDRTTGLAGVV
jgi:hypothetical protein